MRSTRLLGVLALLLAPSLASGQEKNPFTDSWFWGAKYGETVLHTSVARTVAPVIGAEWLITRSWYGLHVGVDQAYFDAVSTVDDAPTRGVVRRVDIRDMRRLQASMYMFPRTFFNSLRPYVGVGLSVNMVVRANSEGTQFTNSSARDTVLFRIEQAKTRTSLLGTVGAQLNIHRFAPFIQATAMPTKGSGQFLINGDGFTYNVEGGIRFNFGSAIEKLR